MPRPGCLGSYPGSSLGHLTLGKSLNCFVPQFPHPCNGTSNRSSRCQWISFCVSAPKLLCEAEAGTLQTLFLLCQLLHEAPPTGAMRAGLRVWRRKKELAPSRCFLFLGAPPHLLSSRRRWHGLPLAAAKILVCGFSNTQNPLHRPPIPARGYCLWGCLRPQPRSQFQPQVTVTAPVSLCSCRSRGGSNVLVLLV